MQEFVIALFLCGLSYGLICLYSKVSHEPRVHIETKGYVVSEDLVKPTKVRYLIKYQTEENETKEVWTDYYSRRVTQEVVPIEVGILFGKELAWIKSLNNDSYSYRNKEIIQWIIFTLFISLMLSSLIVGLIPAIFGPDKTLFLPPL